MEIIEFKNMIKGGYILQPRKIKDSDISTAPPHVREIWNYLLREANSSDKVYNGHEVKRGQLFRTYKDIQDGTKWMIGWRKMTYNENQTKKAMKFLRETKRITTKKELGGVLITICNYDYYQNPKNYERPNDRTIERTIDELGKNQCGTTYNKKQEEEEENIYMSKKDKQLIIFDNFRKKYLGTKRGNETEFDNFVKQHKDWKTVLPALESILDDQIKAREQLKSKGEFVPSWKNLKTWINQRCWEEEIENGEIKEHKNLDLKDLNNYNLNHDENN